MEEKNELISESPLYMHPFFENAEKHVLDMAAERFSHEYGSLSDPDMVAEGRRRFDREISAIKKCHTAPLLLMHVLIKEHLEEQGELFYFGGRSAYSFVCHLLLGTADPIPNKYPAELCFRWHMDCPPHILIHTVHDITDDILQFLDSLVAGSPYALFCKKNGSIISVGRHPDECFTDDLDFFFNENPLLKKVSQEIMHSEHSDPLFLSWPENKEQILYGRIAPPDDPEILADALTEAIKLRGENIDSDIREHIDLFLETYGNAKYFTRGIAALIGSSIWSSKRSVRQNLSRVHARDELFKIASDIYHDDHIKADLFCSTAYKGSPRTLGLLMESDADSKKKGAIRKKIEGAQYIRLDGEIQTYSNLALYICMLSSASTGI